MSGDRYPVEVLPRRRSDWDEITSLDEMDIKIDNGTMPENVETLRQAVVGRRIVKTERRAHVDEYERKFDRLVITLDDGTQVRLADTSECCAYTELTSFLVHPERVDHVILGVGTTEQYTRWHIYADLGDVLELTVSWTAGNPFYYGYGFDIDVVSLDEVQS